MSWSGGDPDPSDIVTYDIYFGTTCPPPLVEISHSSTNYDPGVMQFSTQYYWKIISWDDRGGSTEGPTWDFTTETQPNTPPYTPSDPNPTNHQTNININTDLTWTGGDPDPGDTVTYDIYFGTTTPPPKIINNQTQTTYNPGTLNYETTYYWQITAWDNNNAHTTGPTWDFTTMSNPNNPPDPPIDPIPVNGSYDISLNPTLSVYVSDIDGDMLNVSFYDASDNSEIGTDINVPSGTRASTIWSNLEPLTVYTWYAIADDGEHLTQSDTWEFITIIGNVPPNQPNKPDGPSEVRPNMEYDFSSTSIDPDDDQIYYMWEWGDGNFSDWLGPFESGFIINTSYNWSEKGDYEVRVKAKDIYDQESNWSDPLLVSVIPVIEIENIQPGYVYLSDSGYGYVYIFEMMGISMVLNDQIDVNVSTNSEVASVKFSINRVLLSLYDETWDNSSSDGFFSNFSTSHGIYNVSAFAYDEYGTEIGSDHIDLLIYIRLRGQQRLRLLNRR